MEDEELDGNGKRLRFRLRVLEERLHDIRGHLVTDGRGGPSPVAVGLDELDDGMIGGPGSEACPVVHLVLQRGEERLGHGAAVAVAGTAARQAHGRLARAHSASVLWRIGSSYRCGKWRFRPRTCATSPTPAPSPRCRWSCGRRATANHHARAQVDHGD